MVKLHGSIISYGFNLITPVLIKSENQFWDITMGLKFNNPPKEPWVGVDSK
jgi:hypothetical protein